MKKDFALAGESMYWSRAGVVGSVAQLIVQVVGAADEKPPPGKSPGEALTALDTGLSIAPTAPRQPWRFGYPPNGPAVDARRARSARSASAAASEQLVSERSRENPSVRIGQTLE